MLLFAVPVRFERFGYLDVKGMFYSSKKVDLEMKKLYDQEVALKVMRQQSEKVSYSGEYALFQVSAWNTLENTVFVAQ